MLYRLQYIILQNENRLNKISNYASNLYENVMGLYEKHAAAMGELVRKRCVEFSGILRKALQYIDKKEEDIAGIEKRVWIFENTLRESK